MKKTIVIAVAALISAFASAQTKEGDRLFAHWNYFEAAEAYQNAAEKKPSQDIYYKLGQCYQEMNRYKQAGIAYDKVNAMGQDTNARFYLDYGLVLKSNERYADAKNAFEMYESLMPSDQRGKFYISSCDVVMQDHTTDLPVAIIAVSSLNSSAANNCPVIYKDGIVFASSRETEADASLIYGWDGEHYLDLFYAKRGMNDTGFGIVEPIPGTRNRVQDGPACFSKGFDTMYFNSMSMSEKSNGIVRNKIYSVVNKNGEWVDLTPFQFNNDSFSVATPYLSADGSRLYFSSDMPGGYGGFDMYYCVRQDNGWSKPVNMGPNINTFGDEKFPAMDDSGNFYFSSDGYMGYGGLDICVSKNINGTFTQASVMKSPINSAGDDFGITFATGGRKGYFSSNRNTENGYEDIYYFNLDKDNLPCFFSTSGYIIGFACPPQPKPLANADTIVNLILETTMTVNLPLNPIIAVNVENTPMLIHFDYDRNNIRPDAAVILDSIAMKMREDTHLTLSINGYCDWRGTYDYNQILSDNRSASTVRYLASKGINRNRMVPKGYGKTNILSKCTAGVICTNSEYQEDRRAEMNFIPQEGKELATLVK